VTKVAELRELGDDELIERLESFKEELFNLRFQLATGQLDSPMRIKQVRHDVARILTVLRERHLEQEIEEGIAKAGGAALVHAHEGRAEKAGRRGLRRFRGGSRDEPAEEEPAEEEPAEVVAAAGEAEEEQ
jgi:large subunit ribosomal protein L29